MTIELKLCKEKGHSCYACKNTKCFESGEIISDCPKYYCDRKNELHEDCESCAFIKEFRKDVYGE